MAVRPYRRGLGVPKPIARHQNKRSRCFYIYAIERALSSRFFW